jgi:hypothetical protein
MKPGQNQGSRCVGKARTLRGGSETDFARKARIAVRHADGTTLMMSVNEFEPVFFTQLDNYVLIGIAHDREKMIDALSCNRRRNRLQYFPDDSSRKFDIACAALRLFVEWQRAGSLG